jgi:hypothetical protein
MNKRELQSMLQANGMSRTEARRRVYGSTWKLSTAPGRGVQLAITKEEKARREALKDAFTYQEDSDHAGEGKEARDVSEGGAASQPWRSRRVEDSSKQDGSGEVR